MRILVSYFRRKIRDSVSIEQKGAQFRCKTSRNPDLPVRKDAFTNREFTGHAHIGAHPPDSKDERHQRGGPQQRRKRERDLRVLTSCSLAPAARAKANSNPHWEL